MSYDISLYDREFLKDALATSLGDWTSAPALSPSALASVERSLQDAGFQAVDHPAGFAEFLVSQGVEPSRDYRLEREGLLVTAQVFSSSVVFSMPASQKPYESVAYARHLARDVAFGNQLGYYDPQTGEVAGEAA